MPSLKRVVGRWSILVVFFFGFPILPCALSQEVDSCCAPVVECPTLGNFKLRDTLTALCIYASAPIPPPPLTTNLPDFWRKMWNISEQVSVPRFYKENSDSSGAPRYLLTVDPYGKLPESTCFISQYYPDGNGGGDQFIRDILMRADSVINFANYDRDGDKFVDALFMCIQEADGRGIDKLALDPVFTTLDSVGGVPIKIKNTSGVTFRTQIREAAVQSAAHEWGHRFTLLDYYALHTIDWWTLGFFSVMANHGFSYRASPFHPFQNQKFLKWDQPVDITTTTYNLQMGDYFTSTPNKKFYRVRRAGSNVEYFEISYHSVVQFTSTYWEKLWPREGLLIAHIVDTVCSPLRQDLKQIDLELPGSAGFPGLRDVINGQYQSTPNDSLGKDSLDLKQPYIDKPGTIGIGSETCLWNAATKQNFDDKTNPSSRFYGSYGQNAFSFLGIENIQINVTTASADFILNAKYGRISSATTWGPGLVSVIGDVTVDSGVTLTIAAGTTIKFQKNYDNMKSGGDTTKSRMIIKGTVNFNGTQTDSIICTSSSSTSPANGDWGGLFFETSGGGTLAFVRISYADTVIRAKSGAGAVVVRNCTFNKFKSIAVYSERATVNLGKTTISPPDCGKNNILMKSATSGAKAVTNAASSGTLYASGNWWDTTSVPSSWFSGTVNKDWVFAGPATPDSCPYDENNGPSQGGGDPKVAVVPLKFELGQNYPNPFNPTTTIRYSLANPVKVELKIYNILGELVRTLVNKEQPAGRHEASWDGKDESSRNLPSGIYLYQIKAGDFTKKMKMLLVK